MAEKITIMIVEDNKVYHEALLDIIDLTKNMECIGAFHAAEPCLQKLKAPDAPKPSILLLDLNLPGLSGLSVLPLIKKKAPETEVIILTQNNDYHTVLQAIHQGANGYLLKGGSIAAIRETIREVHGGASFIDPQLSRLVLNTLCNETKDSENPLSPRELEVLELLAVGFSKKEVADQLDLSFHTVVSYVRSIFKKLESPNLAAAIGSAFRRKLI